MTPRVSERRPGRSIWRLIGWGAAVTVLLVPLVAMQITSEVNWTGADFLFAAIMFGIVGGIAELTARLAPDKWYKAGVGVAVLASFLLIWINGAVGIIGSEDNPINLIFLAIVIIAIAGSIAANFRTAGMARTMAAAAAAQLMIGIAALVLGLGASEPPGPFGIFALNLMFVGLWSLSAGLFQRAASEEAD